MTNVPVSQVSNSIIWGNHSSTQYPDISHAVIGGKLSNPTTSLYLRGMSSQLVLCLGGLVCHVRSNYDGCIPPGTGKPAKQVINDDVWYKDTFIPCVQVGFGLLRYRLISSAASPNYLAYR